MDADEDARLEELPCKQCGKRNPVWFAGITAWNLAVGGDAKKVANGILCPTCFHDKWLEATDGA